MQAAALNASGPGRSNASGQQQERTGGTVESDRGGEEIGEGLSIGGLYGNVGTVWRRSSNAAPLRLQSGRKLHFGIESLASD